MDLSSLYVVWSSKLIVASRELSTTTTFACAIDAASKPSRTKRQRPKKRNMDTISDEVNREPIFYREQTRPIHLYASRKPASLNHRPGSQPRPRNRPRRHTARQILAGTECWSTGKQKSAVI